jgi:hypothetical protein
MAVINPYRVIAVEPGTAPRIAEPGEWYRYVIANSHTRVTGRRCGTREAVRSYAEGIADNLNTRVRNGHSLRAPRRTKRTR